MAAEDVTQAAVHTPSPGNAAEVLAAFTRLGLTSFGGPVAHLGYFREEFVARRQWLDDHAYADLVALCQFLPGPASSQVGISIGLFARGLSRGARRMAWLHAAVGARARAVRLRRERAGRTCPALGWIHGLKVAAVAVVAQAVLGMMRTLAPDRERATLAVAAAAIVLLIPSAWAQIAAIASRRALRDLAAACGRAGQPGLAAAECGICGGRGVPRDVLPAPGRLARSRRGDGGAIHQAVRCLLPGRLARVRRRPCRPAAAAGRGRPARLGEQRHLPRGLWRGAGGARAACSPSRPISAR